MHLRTLSLFTTLTGALLMAPRARAASAPDDSFRSRPCRPTVACTADIVAPGHVEVELGYLMRRGEEVAHSTPFLIKVSLFPWLQLQAGGAGGVFVGETQRFEDMFLLGKLVLTSQTAALPAVSFSGAVSMPTASTVAVEGAPPNYNTLFQLYITKEKGIVHGDLNLGLNLYQVNQEAVPMQLWAALAVSVGLPQSFTVTGELYAMNAAPPVAPKDGGFLVALAWAPKSYLIFDVGGDVGFFPEVRTVSVFAGLTMVPFSLYNRAKGPARAAAVASE